MASSDDGSDRNGIGPPLKIGGCVVVTKSADRELGELKARMDSMKESMDDLKSDVDEMRADIRGIRDTISGARGGWKTLAVLLSFFGIGSGGLFLWLIKYIPGWIK